MNQYSTTGGSSSLAGEGGLSISLDPITSELFNEKAKQWAKQLAKGRGKNKATQLRRFYNEICLWDERVSNNQEEFGRMLPFIRMLNAKTAYAEGRNLVNDDFSTLIREGLQQVKGPETMRHFKLFMEAVMGFYKLARPND